MNAAALFESSLALIERVTASVCRRGRLVGADAEDFASSVKIALMEDDYAILRKYSGRSSFEAYLAVVIQNLLTDQRTHTLGRWRPSREAERLGEVGVLLETLLDRDRRSLGEALPIVQRLDPTLTAERAAAMAARFPRHTTRPRAVELDESLPVAAPDAADVRVMDADRRRRSAATSHAMRDALAGLPAEDAMILRFRFGSGMSRVRRRKAEKERRSPLPPWSSRRSTTARRRPRAPTGSPAAETRDQGARIRNSRRGAPASGCSGGIPHSPAHPGGGAPLRGAALATGYFAPSCGPFAFSSCAFWEPAGRAPCCGPSA